MKREHLNRQLSISENKGAVIVHSLRSTQHDKKSFSFMHKLPTVEMI